MQSDEQPVTGGGSGGSGGHLGGGAQGGGTGGASWDGGCVATASTTLPHVRLVVSTRLCSFSLSAPDAGLDLQYQLIIDQPVPGFTPAYPYPYGSDVANLVLDEKVAGGGQSYCVCDQGLAPSACPLPDGGSEFGSATCGPVTLPQGTFERTFHWNGRNWYGPSDTGNPYGPPFPPGDYVFTVSTAPGALWDGGTLSATGTLGLHVLP